MHSKSKVVVKDHGWKQLMATAKQIARDRPFAKVGLLASSADSETVVIGATQEFGSPEKHIPERSFLRATFDKKRLELEQLLEELVGGIYDGKMTARRALGLAGAKLSADVKLYVTTGPGVPPPNAPSTIARKMRKAAGAISRRAVASAARSVEKRGAIAAAAFGDHGDKSGLEQARGVALGRAYNSAMRRVGRRVKQGRLAAAVFGTSAVRTLVDSGRMVGALTWEVLSRRTENE